MDEEITPAIISNNQENLDNMINSIKSDVNRIHIDIMDGNFTPNKSNFFDLELPDFDGLYEAHLMVENPLEWIKSNNKGFDRLIIHYETTNKINEIIDKVKSLNKSISIALNPSTSEDNIEEYYNELDQVNVMSVEPGRYGSEYISDTEEKVSRIRRENKDIDIEVDGGQDNKTIKRMKKAGANIFASGSFIFKNKKLNASEAINKLQKILNNKTNNS